MTGGLLPGTIYLLEFANYSFIRFSKETGKQFENTYYLNRYSMNITLNLN